MKKTAALLVARASLLAGASLLASVARPALATDGTVFLGVGKPTDRRGTDFDWGPVLAGSLGGRISDYASLHGQLTMSLLDPDVPDSDGNFVQLAFVPMIHLLGDRADVDLVLGPQLGLYRMWGEFDFTIISGDIREWGLEAGLLAGAFFAVSKTLSIGMYVEYSHLFPQELCVEIRNGPDDCDDDDLDESNFLSFGLGLRF